MEEKVICTHCGAVIEEEDYDTIYGDPICPDCVADYTVTCDHCGAIIWDTDSISDESTVLCSECYDTHYTRCNDCNCVIHYDNAYEFEGEYYCRECYDEVRSSDSINDYNYKPTPIFYGDDSRYFGVELEIDIGGKDSDNADEILGLDNYSDEHIYIKSDGSLNDGMEIVTHPMTLEYHLNEFCWKDIVHKCIQLGYRSHQTSTCGLHIHVNKNSLGKNSLEQDEVISRILYFVEHHWNELLKFSRRSEYNINRWAARYGYENDPKAILDKAKKGNKGRYAAVNLCNYHTVEFRMFRGTLKYNTLIAALQMVNHICDAAFLMSDEQMKSPSWSDFVMKITESELIQYLKERRLYINEEITTEEEV